VEKDDREADVDGGAEILPEEDSILELLTFSLSGVEFAFRVSEVEEIIKYQKATRVPTLPDYVTGITSLRGKIIPVVNLKRRLKIGPSQKVPDMPGDTVDMTENGVRQKILILSGPGGLIGADIDNILGVLRFPGGKVLDPPAHLSEEEAAFIEGVVILEKRFISIFRSEKILDIGAD
jgi:purine-binding chemotaxis protein CheW